MRIVFFGTPEFAVASLRVMVENNYRPVAVVTVPDKPAGRGLKFQSSAVKKYAESQDIPVLQPSKLRDSEFIRQLHDFKPDLQFVVAFRMLPEEIWNFPPLGTWNLHASLLPQYRGAAPINHAIINGEKQTGLTTFRLKHEIDTGDIALTKQVEIDPNETAGSLHDRMMHEGAKLVLETIQSIEKGNLHLRSQNEFAIEPLKHAPKITADACRLNIYLSSQEVHNKVRGLSPYPGAVARLLHNGEEIPLKIYLTGISLFEKSDGKPGDLLSDAKSFLKLRCGNGWVDIFEIQVAGKKRLPIAEFLRGFKLSENTKIL